jgi:hypothetical protein
MFPPELTVFDLRVVVWVECSMSSCRELETADVNNGGHSPLYFPLDFRHSETWIGTVKGCLNDVTYANHEYSSTPARL